MKLHPAAELAAYKTGQIKAAESAEKDDRYIRLAAEFDNYKKRTARQFAEIVKNANEELILDILGALDDFHHAIEKTGNGAAEEQRKNHESPIAGMKMIYDKFLATLKSRGVEQMDTLGQKFDPNYHHAVMQLESDEEEGTIIGVVAPGYTMNGKVIRPAQVIVASSR